MDPSLNMEFIHVSCTPYTYSLKVIQYSISNNFVHKAKFHGLEFPTHGVRSVLTKVVDFGAVMVWIWNIPPEARVLKA